MSTAAAPSHDARRKDLSTIHILKARLHLSDQTYRDLLWTQARVRSAKNLDDHGRRQVIAHLQSQLPAEARGFKRRPHNLDAGGRRELKKIEALLTDAGKPWAYAEAILKQQTRGRKETLAFASPSELSDVIAALDRMNVKRLHAALGDALASCGWTWADAGVAAELLFGFDRHHDVSRYSQTMSQVLRWLRGELAPSCPWSAAR